MHEGKTLQARGPMPSQGHPILCSMPSSGISHSKLRIKSRICHTRLHAMSRVSHLELHVVSRASHATFHVFIEEHYIQSLILLSWYLLKTQRSHSLKNRKHRYIMIKAIHSDNLLLNFSIQLTLPQKTDTTYCLRKLET